MLNRLVERVQTDGKSLAKRLYRRPLIEWAGIWRKRFLRDTCFVGITGSAGKTTTKELLRALLARSGSCAANSDTNNQLFSVARTLIAVAPGTHHCVQELGAFEPGGLDPMIELLAPNVAIVTCIGLDHRKAFRTREAIAAEKARLVAAIPSDGLVVLNADDPLVVAMASSSRARVVTFGSGGAADYRGEILESAWPQGLTLRVRCGRRAVEIPTRLRGRHQALSVLAAVSAARELGVELADCARILADLEPLRARMSVHATSAGVTFLRDDAKAPLWSLALAFDVVREAQASRKIIVLGTLSDYSESRSVAYRKAVAMALAAGDHVLVVGRHVRTPPGAEGRLHTFDGVREAFEFLRGFAQSGDLVLLKGSNHADHLSRICLAFDRAVKCWAVRCGRERFCEDCRLLPVNSASGVAA